MYRMIYKKYTLSDICTCMDENGKKKSEKKWKSKSGEKTNDRDKVKTGALLD